MNIVFIGPPGSGKGTQSKELITQYGFIQLSTGDLLRSSISQGTELGLKAKDIMNSGKLVPDQLILDLVKSFLVENKGKSIIFDGFPRTVAQAEALDKLLVDAGTKIHKVFNFKTDPQILVERLTGRRTCSQCGEIYHIRTKPSSKGDKCEKCNGDLVQRKDDKEDVIKERLEQFEINTLPTINFYGKSDAFVSIDCSQAPEVIFNEIKKNLALTN